MFRVIKREITVPKTVTVKQSGCELFFKGSNGESYLNYPSFVKVTCSDGFIEVSTAQKIRDQIKIGATIRQLIANKVIGVSEGFKKVLIFEGIGFRASVAGNKVNLSLGYSHPIVHELPDNVSASVEGNKIILQSCEKDILGQTASEIKRYRMPEPYKGKGIRYDYEVIRRKAGKTSKK